MKEDRSTDITKEILDWSRQNTGASYYDMKAYAYDNDKHEWLEVLRNRKRRYVISLYFRSKRKSGEKYNRTYDESLDLLIEAEKAYRERNNIEPWM